MGYIPIFLDVAGRRCLVIGGGEIASRKVRALIEAGAVVTVLSPELCAEIGNLAQSRTIRHLGRRYQPGDLNGFVLAYVAAGDAVTGEQVAAEARALGIPINVADAPELCSFIAPAVVRQGDLQIAVSTNGASPAMAVRIREDLELLFGPEYAELLDLMRAARAWLKRSEPSGTARGRRLRALAASALRECLKRGDYASAEVIVQEQLGAGVTLKELGFDAARLDQAVPARINGSR